MLKFQRTVLIIIILHLLISILFAQDIITNSQGEINLLLNHEENALNLYNRGGNTAAMMQAISRDWITLSGMIDYGQGSLRRQLDAGESRMGDFKVEGIKTLSEKQMFWGRASYNRTYLNDLPYTLEPNPYDNDPMVLRDSTIAATHYSGQEIAVRYLHVINSKLNLGLDFDYNIMQGIRKKYVRSRVLYRDACGKMFLSYQLNPAFQLGAKLAYQNIQNQVEVSKSRIDGQDPRVFRYRSEEIFREKTGSFDHYDKRFHYFYALQILHHFASLNLSQFLQIQYHYEDSDVLDQTSKKDDDSNWYCDYYNLNYEIRKFSPSSKWDYGLRWDSDYLSSFSQHPLYDILITERDVFSNRVEIGIGRRFNKSLESLGIQFGYQHIQDDYIDHQIHIDRTVKNNQFITKFGGAIRINQIHTMLFGLNWGDYRLNTWSPRYLNEHNLYKCSLGFMEQRVAYDVNALLEMFVREDRESFENYSGWQLKLQFKIFKN